MPSNAWVFGDSFDHYTTAEIPQKWSTAGGSLDTRVKRTGVQSLRFQSGDAPSATNFLCPSDPTYYRGGSNYGGLSQFVVGFALNPGILAGTILELWAQNLLLPNPAEKQLSLGVNPDGTVTLYDGSGLAIGTTSGMVQIGEFYYIQLQVDLSAHTAIIWLSAPGDTDGSTTQNVLSVSGFSTSQTVVDALFLVGPAGPDFFWIDDFFLCDDSNLDNEGLLGPVSILLSMPIAPGTPVVHPNYFAWDPLGDHIALVDSVPPNDGDFISFDQVVRFGPPQENTAETYQMDLSVLPASLSVVAAVQGVLRNANQGGDYLDQFEPVMAVQNDLSNFGLVFPALPVVVGSPHFAAPGSPFLFLECGSTVDPISGDFWAVADWTGNLLQVGPGMAPPPF